MSYARDRRRHKIKKLKKENGKGWKNVYRANANQIKIEKAMAKEGR
jgi:hypothetical protein